MICFTKTFALCVAFLVLAMVAPNQGASMGKSIEMNAEEKPTADRIM